MAQRSKWVIGGVFLLLTLIALSLFYQSWRKSEMTSTHQTQQSKKTNLQPDLKIDSNGLSNAIGVIETTYGKIRFKFYSQDAPVTVQRIVELINQGFYDGLTFHRVIPNFVIQGGDPEGNGTGGSGKKLNAEFNKRKHIEGTLAMARAADPHSADSQFYIVLSPQPHLDNNYTVFGQVIEGMDLAKQIRPGDQMKNVFIE